MTITDKLIKQINTAIRESDIGFIQKLIATGFDVNQKLENGETLLWIAAEFGNEAVTRFLIEHGADVNVKNELGMTPLFECWANEQVAEILIEHGANVNERSNDKKTPLHFANSGLDEVLVKHGADVNARDNTGRTPLFEPMYVFDNVEVTRDIMQTLLEHGADVNIQDNHGKTCLEYVQERIDAGYKDLKIVKELLLSYGTK